MALTGVIGGGIVLCGALTGLVLADVPMVLVAGVAFGLMGFLGVFARLLAWWLSRGPGPLRRAASARRARPRWTSEDRAWMKSAGVRLPESRERP